MAEITLRTAGSIASANATVKGSPLTNLEVDNNFSNINIVVDGLSNVFGITTGQATITGNLVPAAANTYDLGTAAAPFRDLYVSGNSIKLGSITLSTLGGNIALDGTEVLSASGGAVPADASITEGKIATGAVTEDKIDTGAVTENKLGAGAVTVNKIGTGAVTNPKLSDDIDIKGTLTVQPGSVSSPSLAANSDSNTGVFFPTADHVSVAVGGTEAVNVTSAGYFTAVYSDRVVALGNTDSAVTVDCKLGTVFTATLNANTTITVANAKSEGATSFTLELINDGQEGLSVALSGGTFRYPFGAISRTTTAGGRDIWFFTTFNGGTDWYVAIPIGGAATS